MAAFVLALIRVRSVNLAQIAGAHRLQLPPLPEVPGRVQLRVGNHRTADPAQNPEQKLVLSLDRTEWKLGRLSINLLFIGGVAYPLGKAGSSNLRERLGLLRRLLTFLPKARIVRIGSLPAPALRWRKVPYTLRIKAGSRVTYRGHSRPVQRLFRHLGKPCPNRFGCGGNPPIAEGGVPASDYRGRSPAGPCSIRPALGDRNPLQGFDFESTHGWSR